MDVQTSMFDLFNEREINEIEFARVYSEDYRHGTDGHSRLLLIAKLANALEFAKEMLTDDQWAEVLCAKSEFENA